MEQKLDGRISLTINKLITSLYLLTPKTVQVIYEACCARNRSIAKSSAVNTVYCKVLMNYYVRCTVQKSGAI